jgi:TetR/AcrR family transcriptional repressor of nem operon
MKDAIRKFFDENEAWLRRVLEAGRRDTSLSFEGNSRDAARGLTAALEGAMLLARSYGDAARFATAAARLLDEFTPSADGRQRRVASPRGRARGHRL